LDLPAGKLRVKKGGGHGGHNGLKSIIQHLGDAGFVRIKFGIGRPPSGLDPTAWVLGRATPEELAREARMFAAVIAGLDLLLAGDLDRARNQMHLQLQEQG
ncbi:MAG: peptidyl-tRNA hydrolase, partial [Zetaproteobacteria bacterium]